MSGFGRKGLNEGDNELARRREAFLAAERDRRAEEGSPEAPVSSPTATRITAPNAYRRDKTTGMAYLLWFIMAMMGAHRFYLGLSATGAAMAGMWVGGWLLVVAGVPAGLLGVAITAIWAIVDAFLIPGLVRQVNNRPDPVKAAAAFA